MYNFIDVTETSEGLSLPSEALKINGEYIENLITGYRTLTVEGREALSPELSTYETGIRDGSKLLSKRYPARTIRITYQLIAATNEEFRAAYNKLAAILDVTDAQLIFNDEQDKFFTGTPAQIGEVPPGRNAVVGEFEILCLDPFKYSLMEYEAVAGEGETGIVIDYNGTYKSYPTLEAEFYNENEASEDGETVTELTGDGECGYVAFFNDDEKIIQLGDPEENDLEEIYDRSQTLVNQKFDTASSWGTAAKSLWGVNSGKKLNSTDQHNGNVGIGVAAVVLPQESPITTKLLTVTAQKERPYFQYEVSATATRVSQTSVNVTVSIAAWLTTSSSYFGKGYKLLAYVRIGNTAMKGVTLIDYTDRWKGTTIHKKTVSFNLTVDASATKIGNVVFDALRVDQGGQSGVVPETKCADIIIPKWIVTEPDKYYLTPTDYGTGRTWHGSSITRTIPADAAGDVGATNFQLYYSHRLSIGAGASATSQIGAFQVLLINGSGQSGTIVAGLSISKNTSGKTAKILYYVNNKLVKTGSVDLSYGNVHFRNTTSSTITKYGNAVTFNIGGIGGFLREAFVDESIADLAVNEVTFVFAAYGTKTPLECNGLYWAKFRKDKCETWRDVPNKFGTNDTVTADCKTGEIFLNGLTAPAYGALGNDWEGFYLRPGLNQIGFSYSDWVDPGFAPTFKVKYREVFL